MDLTKKEQEKDEEDTLKLDTLDATFLSGLLLNKQAQPDDKAMR